MTNLLLVPFKSVGRILFGASRADVCSLFEHPPAEIAHPFSAMPIDHFENSAIQVSYDGEGRVEHVELSAPAQVVFNDAGLIGHAMHEVCDSLGAQGFAAHIDADDHHSVYFLTAGLALTPDGETNLVRSVGVFRADTFSLEDGTNWKPYRGN